MQRISLAWFANMGAALSPLVNAYEPAAKLTALHLYRMKSYLITLSEHDPLDLRASRSSIYDLLAQINYVMETVEQQEARIEERKYNIWSISSKLQTLLDGELSIQPIYHVWPKRAYNIEALVAEGDRLFSADVRAEFNEEEKYNIKEAGKCLAFEVPTAAAFHIFRCAESVLRRYYELVVGKLPKPKMRNWGAYIKHLKECGADRRVIVILEQIKDLHRNPVIHPETRMTNEESLSLIGIIDSALTAMVADMKIRREQTSPSLPLVMPEMPRDLIERLRADGHEVEEQFVTIEEEGGIPVDTS